MKYDFFRISSLFIMIVVGNLGCSSLENTDTVPDIEAATFLSPEDVLEAFMQAGIANDRDALLALFTQKVRDRVSESKIEINEIVSMDYTIGDTVVNGEEAAVAISVVENGNAQDMNFKMRTENGEWRIYGLGIVIGGEEQIVVDLETN